MMITTIRFMLLPYISSIINLSYLSDGNLMRFSLQRTFYSHYFTGCDSAHFYPFTPIVGNLRSAQD